MIDHERGKAGFKKKYNLARYYNRVALRLMLDKVEPINEKIMQVIESYCSEFGCNKKLSLIESLCGNKCREHMIKKTRLFYNGKL